MTTGPRMVPLSIAVEEETYALIVQYMKDAKLSSKSEAVRRILRPGIRELKAPNPLTVMSQQP